MQSLRSFIRNTMWYFIPFLIMTVVAIVSQDYIFSMLLKQNCKIIQNQLLYDLETLEEEIYSSKKMSLEMSLDSSLSADSMTELGLLSIRGIERIGEYRMRLSVCSELFVACSTEKIITENGISSFDVFCEDIQRFSEKDKKAFQELLVKRERISTHLIERETNSSILLLYYYPENISDQEKWIGFMFDDEKIAKRMQGTLGDMDSYLLLSYCDQKYMEINQLSGNLSRETLNVVLDSIVNENKEYSNYTLLRNNSKILDIKMYILLNNSVFNQSVRREQSKIFTISISSFVLLALILWGYGKFQYKKMQTIEKMAITMYPDLKSGCIRNNYDLIQKVLENDIIQMNYHNQMLGYFRKESRKQLIWLLLKNTPPEDISIDWLMENFGINDNGGYYCVLEFLLNRCNGNVDFLDELNRIVMYHFESSEQGTILMVVVTMYSRDASHAERISFVEDVLQHLRENNFECKGIASGLVYEQLTEIHSSQEEAFSLLSMLDKVNSKKNVIEQVTMLFFDEHAGITKHVPHMTADKLQAFREAIVDEKIAKALGIFESLLLTSEEMTEELLIYIRYKIVQILLDVWQTQGNSQECVSDLLGLMRLGEKDFQLAAKNYIVTMMAQTNSKDVKAEDVLAYIQEHAFDAEISIIDVADYFGISKRSVGRIMNDTINKNYKEYINELRLAKSYELLKVNDLDIKTIAHQVGYYNVTSFIRWFKQMSGMSPGEYRAKMCAENLV